MESNILSWSLFLLRNINSEVNGKTYKKDDYKWVLELYKQWEDNVDVNIKTNNTKVSLDQMMRDFWTSRDK